MKLFQRLAEVLDPSLKYQRLSESLADQGEPKALPPAEPALSVEEQWRLAERMVDDVADGINKARADKLVEMFGKQDGSFDVKAFERASELLPSWLNNKAQWGEWDTEKAISDGIKSSVWVYACCYRISKSVSSIPLQAQERKGGKWVPKPDSPLQDLLDSPNPKFSRQTFMERITMHLLAGGNAIVQKVRVRGVPVELWPIKPSFVQYTPSRQHFISKYTFKQGDVKEDIDPADVIHLMFEDPSNPYWGMSPMQAAARVIDTDIEAVKWNKIALQNRAVADGAFVTDRPLNQDLWEDLRQQIRDQHQGPDNAREPWVLGGGAKWQQMAFSPAEMDFIESRKLTREEICAAYMIPPPLVGIYDNATLANIETARRIFWEDTLSPLINDITETFDLALAAEFGPNWRVVADLSNVSVLLAVLLDKLEAAWKLFQMGVPFSIINEFLDLGVPAYQGAERGWISGSMTPTDMFNVDAPGLEDL